MRDRLMIGSCMLMVLIFVAGCATQSANAAPSVSQASAAVPSASASPATTAVTLAETSRVFVAELAEALATPGGTANVSPADGGSRVIVAQGNDRRGQPVWNLVLEVTNQGRASDGQLVAQGRTWKVTPGTGAITIEQTPEKFELSTQRAVTLTGIDTPTVNTPMVVSLQGAVK